MPERTQGFGSDFYSRSRQITLTTGILPTIRDSASLWKVTRSTWWSRTQLFVDCAQESTSGLKYSGTVGIAPLVSSKVV